MKYALSTRFRQFRMANGTRCPIARTNHESRQWNTYKSLRGLFFYSSPSLLLRNMPQAISAHTRNRPVNRSTHCETRPTPLKKTGHSLHCFFLSTAQLRASKPRKENWLELNQPKSPNLSLFFPCSCYERREPGRLFDVPHFSPTKAPQTKV